jgi:hypothetical protein
MCCGAARASASVAVELPAESQPQSQVQPESRTKPPAAAARSGDRPRFRPRSTTAWQRIPISVKLVVPLLLLGGAWLGYRAWQQTQTVLAFVAAKAGDAVPPLHLSFFPDELAFTSPSPPPLLGELRLQGEDEILIGPELVPSSALVRYAGPGIGTGVVHVVRGKPTPPTALRAPARLQGRAGTPYGFVGLGLRGLGLRPVAGARVLGLGGGEHGVPLCEATTDAAGSFVLEGFAEGQPSLGVRVLADGYAVAYVEHVLPDDDEPIVPLVATQPIEGIVLRREDVPPVPLLVLARGLPGVAAAVAADGSFRLDHVPPALQPRLLVYGLPPSHTHQLVHASPGDRGVRIEVVRAARIRGRVVDRLTQVARAGAFVWHEHGPAGRIWAETASDGSFELDLAPPGDIVLFAQHITSDPLGDRRTQIGERRVAVVEGQDEDAIVIRVD